MTRLLFLAGAVSLGAAALGVSGCSLTGECQSGLDEVRYANTVRAAAPALGDTLTLLFVDTLDPALRAFVPAGLRLAPSADGAVEVGYDAEAEAFSLENAPRLSAVARGDTVFVHVEGALDPSLFAQVCTPALETLRVELTSIQAPTGVRAFRVSLLGIDELPPRAAQALRQRDAARPARLFTV